MPILVNVIGGCTVSATPLVWNVPVPTSSTLDSTATITLQCVPNTAYTVDIDDGLYAQGNMNRRVFNAAANDFIRYDIYRDPPRSKVWGKGNAQNYPGNSGASGSSALTVYGRLSSTRNVAAGGYRDTLTVTVNF